MVLPSAAQETNQGQKQQQNNDWKKSENGSSDEGFGFYFVPRGCNTRLILRKNRGKTNQNLTVDMFG
jgi:hypothetical protein